MLKYGVLNKKNNRQYKIEGEDLIKIFEEESRLLLSLGVKKINVPVSSNRFYNQQKDIYTKWYPEIVDRAKAMAVAIGQDEDEIIQAFMTEHIGSSHKSEDTNCCVILINSKDGVFVGRNFDGKQVSEELALCVEYQLPNGSFWINSDLNSFRSTVTADEYRIRPQEGWTRDIYIAINSGPAEKVDSGLSPTQVIEKALLMRTNGAKTENIIDFVEKVPVSRGFSLCLADRDGKLMVIEKTPSISEKRVSTKMIWATNHFISHKLQVNNQKLFSKIPFHASFPRYGYIESIANTLVNSNDVSSSLLEALGRSPLNQNFREPEFDCVTSWTFVTKIGETSKIVFSPNNEKYKENLVLKYM